MVLPETQVVVLLFLATDCPVANRYAPTINALVAKFASPAMRFFAVYPDSQVTVEKIRQHQMDFALNLPALRDPGHELVSRAGVSVTPEVAVYLMPTSDSPVGTWLYRGRIDDQYDSVSRSRPAPTKHDLHEVLDLVAQGQRPAPRTTKAIGCYIGD